jgi:hypothetical protein
MVNSKYVKGNRNWQKSVSFKHHSSQRYAAPVQF